MKAVALALVLIAAACGAEVLQPEPVGDVPMYDPEPVAEPVTDRDPPRLYDEAAGSAAPVTAGAPAPAGGAGGAGGSTEPPPAAGSESPEPVAGAPAAEPEPTPEPPVAGAPAPEPVVYVNVCKISVGQRYAGHTIGCDDGSRSAYPYFLVRWKTPSAAAASGFATVGCSERVESPCVTGAACRVEDAREGQPAQLGVCQ